jgi:uncharacterized protein (TIGR03086 family)
MIDLHPATETLSHVLTGVRDDQLALPTPCAGATVADLIDHVGGLSLAFTAAATKTRLPDDQQAPQADGARLDPDWRARIPERLDALAEAWREPTAWEGLTQAGPVEMPGGVAALVAINEVVVHGWDIAAATGQPYEVAPELVDAARTFVQASVDQNPDGTPGLFGPPVAVPADASPAHQLLGLTGRDPSWPN